MVKFTSPAAAKLFFANSPKSSFRARLAVAEHGFSLRYTDSAAMLAWCEAAAVNIPSSIAASDAARLIAHLANAHRVCCNFREAESAFRKALTLAPADALILEHYATFLKDTGKLDEAAEYLGRAAILLRGSGESPRLVRTLMETAVVQGESGLAGQAVESLRSAVENIGLLPDSEEREHLARAGFQNLAKSLVDAGRPQEALRIVQLCREVLLQGGELYSLRLDWLMADIAGALGDLDNAVTGYKAVRERYTTRSEWREAALVTLDLARLLLKSRPLQAREEALSVWPVLDALGIARDAREAKLLATVVEKGSEAALIELSAALRLHGLPWRSAGALLPPGTL